MLDKVIQRKKCNQEASATMSEEASAPVFDENFYDTLDLHVEEVPHIYLDTAYNKVNEVAGGDYCISEWDFEDEDEDDHKQYQREVTAKEIADADEFAKANVESGNARAEIYDIKEDGWGEKCEVPKASGTDVWDSAPQKSIDLLVDADKTNFRYGESNELKEPVTDINHKESSTTLSDTSVQEVGVEERSHLAQTKLTKGKELNLNKSLDLILKARDMTELYEFVNVALKVGVRINHAQDNNDTFANVALSKASQLKIDPKIASDIVCKLVSRGAKFGKSYNKINDELKKSEIFKDHEVNLQKATKEFCKRISKFHEIVGSAISQGKLNKLDVDNTTFHLECSEDSVVDVTRVIYGAKSLGESCGGIVEIGQNKVEIEINDGIKNYANLSGNGHVILTLNGLEITLYHDTQNKDRVIVEVSEDDRKKLYGLSDKEKDGKWGSYRLGESLVYDAITRGYFKKSCLSRLQASEIINPSVQSGVGEIIKNLNPSDTTLDSSVNSSVNGVQLSKVTTEQRRGRMHA